MSEAKCLPPEVKVKVLCRVWSGEKISQVANDVGVSRQAIYTWKKRAEEVLCEILKERKRGPRRVKGPPLRDEKPEGSRKGKKTPHFSSQDSIPPVSKSWTKNSILSEESVSRNNGEMPQVCPICGCRKIYKNGTYLRKISNNGTRKMQIVQRYICVWCKSSII
ncbi:helix-turn-helix domain-containing protein [Candidatus Aerophobetes bacterium]|nr:helix-turn-helix domain-containing protein [Candidatus Aerophobetes bacterium]